METLLGLIILVVDIYAIVQIISSGVSTGAKIGWSLLVLLLPVLGVIIWAFAGPRGSATVSS